MALNANDVQQLYVAYLGRAADTAGLEYWTEQVPEDFTLADLRYSLVNDQPEYQELYGDKTREELVTAIYQNMFGRDPEEAGLEYWVDGEGGAVPADELMQLFIDAASEEDRAAFDDKVKEANENPTDPEEPSVPGETFALTDGRDNLVGTDNDDTFIADVGQNQNGAVANALSTGDRLDGGAGRDKLEATLISDNEVDSGSNLAPRPITQNIEEVYIEALEQGLFSSGVSLDATRMENVEEFWSNFSRTDLTINNVNLRGDNLSITKDVTFGLRDVQFGTDFTALFESQALIRQAASQVNSQLLVRIADVSTETPETPLANVNLNLSFDLGSETIYLEGIQSTDGSYAGLVTALRDALAEAGYGDLNVELSNQYEEVTVAGNTVTLPFTAQEILVTDPAGNEFSNVNFTQSAIEPVADGFLVAGNAAPVDPSTTSNLIESNLVLDNAGRGSTAGEVFIGGGSNSNRGVEQINVAVDRDSAIASLASNLGSLQEIHISSLDAQGSLRINAVDAGLNVIEANAFAGNSLTLGSVATPVVNLGHLDAAGTSANVAFNGANFDGHVASLQTGSGNDVITLSLNGVSSSGSTVTQATINAGGGNNTVTVTNTGSTVANTATIITGGGEDTINGNGVSVTVNSGAGNDVIYAENTGTNATATFAANNATWSAPQVITTNTSAPLSQLLYGRDVQVTLAVGDAAAGAFVEGFEATASIEASNGYLTTQRDLYEAAARAINEDPVLNKLATATIDSTGVLQITYLVDGVTSAASVEIEVLGEWSDLNSAQQNRIADELGAYYSDSEIEAGDVETAYNAAAADAAAATTGGTDSSTTGINSINAGAGDDVIVLSSNDATSDTVVFDAGNFGDDTIVHFNAGAAGDVLNFNAWLNNVVSASGSADSEVRVDTDLNAGTSTSITANNVTVVDFDDLNFGATVSFAEMTNSQVLAQLNAESSFGVGAADTDLVGNTQRSLLLVQNTYEDGNAGEYKVFEVTSGTSGDFTGATLVGSIDFGAEQTFDIANFA